jgi:predicted dehydrogenase
LGDIARLHAQGLSANPDIELAVCRGKKPETADAFAQDFGAVVYSSYAEMLDDERVLAVDVCVPNDLHRNYTEAAAAAGKHVICEKPIAMTSRDGLAMIDACRRAGVQLLVAHVLRFWPEYVLIREVLQSRRLGRCRTVTLRRMLSLLLSVQGQEGWRHRPDRMGGAVLDLQIHDIDFLLWTFGVPSTVYCAGARSEDGGLNHVYTTVTYTEGPCALIEASYMLKGDPMIFTAKAVCDNGSLDYSMNLEQFGMHEMDGSGNTGEGPGAASLRCYRPNSPLEVLALSDSMVLEKVFLAELAYFADCVLGRSANEVASAEDAVAAVRVVEACHASIQTGAVIQLASAA